VESGEVKTRNLDGRKKKGKNGQKVGQMREYIESTVSQNAASLLPFPIFFPFEMD
jgi:hypothetical protein